MNPAIFADCGRESETRQKVPFMIPAREDPPSQGLRRGRTLALPVDGGAKWYVAANFEVGMIFHTLAIGRALRDRVATQTLYFLTSNFAASQSSAKFYRRANASILLLFRLFPLQSIPRSQRYVGAHVHLNIGIPSPLC